MGLDPARLALGLAAGPCERKPLAALAEGPWLVRDAAGTGLEADGAEGANTGRFTEGAVGRAVLRGISIALLSPLGFGLKEGPTAGDEPPLTGLAWPLGRKAGATGA